MREGLRRGALCLAGGVCIFALTGGAALAESDGCLKINAGFFDFLNIPPGGPYERTETLSFEQGEVITITWKNLTSLKFEVGGVVVVEVPPDPASGSREVTIPTTGKKKIKKHAIIPLPVTASVAFKCQPPPPTPSGSASETANHLAGLGLQIIEGVGPGSAASLPDSRTAEQKLEAALAEKRAEIRGYQNQIDELIGLKASGLAEGIDEEIKDARQNRKNAQLEYLDLRDGFGFHDETELHSVGLDDHTPGTASDGGGDLEDPEELGDHDGILYAPAVPSPAADVPWPMAYGDDGRDLGGPILAGFDRALMFNGKPIKLWGRLQGAILDGDFDRSGLAGSATLGIVAGFTPRLDLGLYATGFTGNAKSGTLATSVGMSGGGLGAYVKYDLPGGGEVGFSALQLWGSSSSNVGAVTGHYGSTFTKVDASVHFPFWVNGWNLTPAAILTWQRYANNSFVDSSATTIPAAEIEQVVASAVLSVARPILVSRERIKRVTPRFQVQGNWVASQSASPVPVGGVDLLTAGSLSLDLTGGVDLAFHGNGVLSFSLGVAGIGADAQSYRATVSFKKPLN